MFGCEIIFDITFPTFHEGSAGANTVLYVHMCRWTSAKLALLTEDDKQSENKRIVKTYENEISKQFVMYL